VAGDPDAAVAKLDVVSTPLEATPAGAAYLNGAAPDHGDDTVFGAFHWARLASSRRLVAPGGAIAAWFDRLLDAFGGLARQQPARSHWS